MPGSLEPLDVGGVQIPYHFRCPISLDLMSDPVTVCTGQTYDRCSIESWMATGNFTCPVTRAPLLEFNLIPNHTLRRLIQDWCVSNRSFGVDRIPTPKQPADPIVIRMLLNQASSVESVDFELRLSALRKLRGLARDSEKNCAVIVANNAREILISVLFSDVSSNSSELTHESLAILSMILLSEIECLYVATVSGRVEYLVKLLFHSSIDVRVNSAALIEIIAAGIRSPDIRAEISNIDGIFEGIVGILNFPFANERALEIAIKALLALCLVKQHRHKAVTAGSVAALIDKLVELDRFDSERALAAVELLCRIPSGLTSLEAHALTVPLMVRIILKISDRATEYAVSVLLSICSVSEQAQREAVAAGVLTQLLLLLQSDCTQRAKKKAQMLLKLLRQSWPEDSIENSGDFGYVDDIVPF